VSAQPAPDVSWLHRSQSGVSWWGARPAWLRHVVYWAIALALLSATAFDGSARDPPATDSGDVAVFILLIAVVLILAVLALVFTLREWEQVGAARTISRSLVLFTFLLGTVSICLNFARRWGVDIDACRTVGDQEVCRDRASPSQVLGMLSWHAANVVPVLAITDSLEWERPARSANGAVGASILAIRLWVAIGILGVIKRLWDRWGPVRSNPAARP
jgi:hypothetical protein